MEWKSVKDRLPEYGERVLATDGKMVFEMWLKRDGGWSRFGNAADIIYSCELGFEVTHWMPLPEPPKGE